MFLAEDRFATCSHHYVSDGVAEYKLGYLLAAAIGDWSVGDWGAGGVVLHLSYSLLTLTNRSIQYLVHPVKPVLCVSKDIQGAIFASRIYLDTIATC